MELSRGDQRRESALDKVLDEVGALLAVDDPGEGAVLTLDEDAAQIILVLNWFEELKRLVPTK